MSENNTAKFPTFRRWGRGVAHWFFRTPATPARVKSRRFWKRFGVVALILAALGWWNLFRVKPLVVSPATTVITAPLNEQGYVDYVEWLRQQRSRLMKTDENIARILVRELRPNMEQPLRSDWKAENVYEAARIKEAVYRELGLAPDTPETTRLSNFYDEYEEKLHREYPEWEVADSTDAAEFQRLNLLFTRGQNRQRVLQDEAFTQDWLDRNREALDIVVAASKKPYYHYPFSITPGVKWPFSWFIRLPCVQEARHYGRSLAFRGTWRSVQGESGGALEDKIACRRLGSKLGENADFLVDALVGMSIVENSQKIPVAGNPEVEPSREIWQTLAEELAASEIRCNVELTIERDRLGGLDMITHIAATSRWSPRERTAFFQGISGESESDRLPPWWQSIPFWFGYDWNTVMAEYNRLFDLSQRDLDAFRAEMDKINYESETTCDVVKNVRRTVWTARSLQSRSLFLGRMFARLCIPAVNAAREANRRLTCQEQIQRITVAMRLYACDHEGRLPPAFTVDADGKPLQSWRTLLLPYLGYEELYRRIRLDEPWDSPYNAQFHAENLAVYRCPTAEQDGWLADGDTSYSVIVGKETLFADGGGQGINPAELYRAETTRQTTEMFSVVERHGGICWMKPDAEITLEDALSGPNPLEVSDTVHYRQRQDENRPELIGSRHYQQGCTGAFYGGKVEFIPQRILQSEDDKATLWPLYLTGRESPEGGEKEENPSP